MPVDFTQLIIQVLFQVLGLIWWFAVPLIFFFILRDFWLYYIRTKMVNSWKWVMIEVKIPRLVEKGPKAMEQIFSAIYGIYSFGYNFFQKWQDGMVEPWLSLELVGYAGGVYFYVRMTDNFRNLVESAIYAQYPDAEITEAQDYTDLLPQVLPSDAYDLWGCDFILARDNAYPIRTYEYFESAVEEQRISPISAITEVMSKLKEDETIWIQTIVRATGNAWRKDGEALRDQLINRKKTVKPGFLAGLLAGLSEFFKNLFIAIMLAPIWEKPAEQKTQETRMLLLTPGEKDIIEGIEHKIAKLAFEVCMRFVYIDKRSSFTRTNVAAVMSVFHQFNTLNLNSFRPSRNITLGRQPFKQRKVYYKKRRLYDNYRQRLFSNNLYEHLNEKKKRPILNIEELATIYHYPIMIVEAPLLRRVETKKGEPPARLPVE